MIGAGACGPDAQAAPQSNLPRQPDDAPSRLFQAKPAVEDFMHGKINRGGVEFFAKPSRPPHRVKHKVFCKTALIHQVGNEEAKRRRKTWPCLKSPVLRGPTADQRRADLEPMRN